MRCDKCKREMSDDEPVWRLHRNFSRRAGCKPDTSYRFAPCARCGRPVHEHATDPGIVYCGTRCQELLLPPA
jgi:DNA-directed RNA polymerase subunit RPC12/RpoP